LAVDNTVVARVLDPKAGLELRVPVRWVDRRVAVRAQMAVHNADGLPIFLGIQVTKDKPWKPTVYLMLEGVHLRRLDVNGSHTNRTPDRENWQWRTHKHRWSEATADAQAYTPDDIPRVPFVDVTAEHYRSVLEAFLDEVGIKKGGGYAWADPDLGSHVSSQLDGES
jgi:hypothetical protein